VVFVIDVDLGGWFFVVWWAVCGGGVGVFFLFGSCFLLDLRCLFGLCGGWSLIC